MVVVVGEMVGVVGNVINVCVVGYWFCWEGIEFVGVFVWSGVYC